MALGPTQPPMQWVPGALSLMVKRPEREADNSPPSSAEVKECVELYLHSPNTFSWRVDQLENAHIDIIWAAPVSRDKDWLTHSLKSPSWEASSQSASQEIPNLLWNPRFTAVFKRTRHWSLSWARCIQSTISHHTSLRSNLILSSKCLFKNILFCNF
jgi:hypothetical protein